MYSITFNSAAGSKLSVTHDHTSYEKHTDTFSLSSGKSSAQAITLYKKDAFTSTNSKSTETSEFIYTNDNGTAKVKTDDISITYKSSDASEESASSNGITTNKLTFSETKTYNVGDVKITADVLHQSTTSYSTDDYSSFTSSPTVTTLKKLSITDGSVFEFSATFFKVSSPYRSWLPVMNQTSSVFKLIIFFFPFIFI
jgi:hypothetical protein